MKMFFFVAFLAGCGFQTSMTNTRAGVPVSQTDVGAGFNDSAIRDNSLGRKEQCLAEVGNLSDREAYCDKLVKRQLENEQNAVECASTGLHCHYFYFDGYTPSR